MSTINSIPIVSFITAECSSKQEISIIYKNYSELNFLQKTQQAHMSVSFKSGIRGSKDCHVWNIIMY